MKKVLKFEVEEGKTVCGYINCPVYDSCMLTQDSIFDGPCKKYDLSTLKFIGEDEGNS